MKAAIRNRKLEKQDKQIHPLLLPKQVIDLFEAIHPLSGGNPDDLAAWEPKMAGLKTGITFLLKESKSTGKDDLLKAENDMRALQ